MFYRKLVEVYKETGCDQFKPISIVSILNDYMTWSLERNRRNLSPFKFANMTGMQTNESLTFYVFFKNDGPFVLEYFTECLNNSCGERIYLDEEVHLGDRDNVIFCDECCSKYSIKDIYRYIKVNFRIKDEF